ncbi:hypothetical protein LCM10_14800 [Rossellomorea aquimaris]|uniref:hypothetical protein n=1 Tax=Rossellomorea aquimaris TaxID=189382 RepID=UPI001CD1FAFD|nr:hypothetical protein [Rossellomorea aquimaris]MCA1056267.1 hypothetical protein [Rossellomorea aquimaris]
MTHVKRGWTQAEEKLLMDLVESYSAEGHSKKEAFEAVSTQVSRSPSTCSRHYYALRKKKSPSSEERPITMEDCIHYLENQPFQIKRTITENNSLKKEKEELIVVQKKLKERCTKLMEQQKKLQQLLTIIKESEKFSDSSPSSPLMH